ncbi:MAG: hypothetical protein IJ682_07190 [Lachnospiraceae bacterium]|nr:hypothetical protein [Lachnospiraceae bacterium]
MLKEKEAKKIGIRACMDQLGYEYCKGHSDNAISAWGLDENGKLNCFVGINESPFKQKDLSEVTELILSAKDEWEYYASCDVDLKTGTVSMIESRVPVKTRAQV